MCANGVLQVLAQVIDTVSKKAVDVRHAPFGPRLRRVHHSFVVRGRVSFPVVFLHKSTVNSLWVFVQTDEVVRNNVCACVCVHVCLCVGGGVRRAVCGPAMTSVRRPWTLACCYPPSSVAH